MITRLERIPSWKCRRGCTRRCWPLRSPTWRSGIWTCTSRSASGSGRRTWAGNRIRDSAGTCRESWRSAGAWRSANRPGRSMSCSWRLSRGGCTEDSCRLTIGVLLRPRNRTAPDNRGDGRTAAERRPTGHGRDDDDDGDATVDGRETATTATAAADDGHGRNELAASVSRGTNFRVGSWPRLQQTRGENNITVSFPLSVPSRRSCACIRVCVCAYDRQLRLCYCIHTTRQRMRAVLYVIVRVCVWVCESTTATVPDVRARTHSGELRTVADDGW